MALVTRFRDGKGRFAKADGRRRLRKILFDTDTQRTVATTDLRVHGRVGVRRALRPLEPVEPPAEVDPVRFEEITSIQFIPDPSAPLYDSIRDALLDIPDLEDGDFLQVDIMVGDTVVGSRGLTGDTIGQLTETITLDVAAALRDEIGEDIDSPRLMLGGDLGDFTEDDVTIRIRVLRDTLRRTRAPVFEDIE